MLHNISKPKYDLSSHRGVDRPFNIGKQPKIYIFTNEGNVRGAIDKKYQLCCRHELHVLRQNTSSLLSSKSKTSDNELTCQQIQQIIQRKLPEGIRVEVPVRDIIETDKIGALNDDHDNLVEMAVFTIVYNVGEGLVAMYYGFEEESISLIGFGADSFVEVFSAIIVVF